MFIVYRESDICISKVPFVSYNLTSLPIIDTIVKGVNNDAPNLRKATE